MLKMSSFRRPARRPATPPPTIPSRSPSFFQRSRSCVPEKLRKPCKEKLHIKVDFPTTAVSCLTPSFKKQRIEEKVQDFEKSNAAARAQINRFFQHLKTKATDPRRRITISSPEKTSTSSISKKSSSSFSSVVLPSSSSSFLKETSTTNQDQDRKHVDASDVSDVSNVAVPSTWDFGLFFDDRTETERDPGTPKTPEYSPVTPESPNSFYQLRSRSPLLSDHSEKKTQKPSKLPKPKKTRKTPKTPQTQKTQKTQNYSRKHTSQNHANPNDAENLRQNVRSSPAHRECFRPSFDDSPRRAPIPQEKQKREEHYKKGAAIEKNRKEKKTKVRRETNRILKIQKPSNHGEIQKRSEIKDKSLTQWVVRGPLRKSLESFVRTPIWSFTPVIEEKMVLHADRIPGGEFRCPLCWSSVVEFPFSNEDKVLQRFTNFLRWNFSVEPVDNILRKIENEWGSIGYVMCSMENRTIVEGDYVVWYREDKNCKTFDRRGFVRKPRDGFSLYPVCFRGVGKILAIVQPQNKDPVDHLFIIQPILYCFAKEYQRDLKKREKNQQKFIQIECSHSTDGNQVFSSFSSSASKIFSSVLSAPSAVPHSSVPSSSILSLPSISLPVSSPPSWPTPPGPLLLAPPAFFNSRSLTPSTVPSSAPGPLPGNFGSNTTISNFVFASVQTEQVHANKNSSQFFQHQIQNHFKENKEKEQEKKQRQPLFYIVLSGNKCLRLYHKDTPLSAWTGTFLEGTSFFNLSLQETEKWSSDEPTFLRLFLQEKLIEMDRFILKKKKEQQLQIA